MENWCKPLKKNFPWKFLQKLLKSINFCIYLQIDLKDISVSKFWLKIHIPGEISNHLIGHTIYFHEKIRFSYFRPRCFFCNGSMENANLIFHESIKCHLSDNWKFHQESESWVRILKLIYRWDRHVNTYENWYFLTIFTKNFQGKFFKRIYINSQL